MPDSAYDGNLMIGMNTPVGGRGSYKAIWSAPVEVVMRRDRPLALCTGSQKSGPFRAP
jgi:hypothetical protein